MKAFLTLGICFFCSIAALQVQARNNTTCDIVQGKPLINAYGPWDFTNPAHKDKLHVVLIHHFTPEVERLMSGKTGEIMGDIDYTLRAIPNYHRALAAMGKYYRQQDNTKPLEERYYSAECYFRRAIYMQPADAVSKMLYGMHLHMTNQHGKAEKIYKEALATNPKYAELHYNLGLLYVDMNKLEHAVDHARKAYELGYPLHGLKNKIRQKGGSV